MAQNFLLDGGGGGGGEPGNEANLAVHCKCSNTVYKCVHYMHPPTHERFI